MATETETLSFSLPTSTAPTDVSESTCMPHSGPFLQQQSAFPPQHIPAEWDTRIPPMHTPATHAQQFCNESSSSGSGSGCFNDGGLLYRVQAERECREGPGKTVEEACQRSLNHFPCPGLAFPMPALDFDFRIAVRLNQDAVHVDSGNTKEITTVAAGVWSGSFGHGRVIAGGYDLGQARGFRPMRLVEGAFVIQTSDEQPALLEMRTRGSLSGPADVLDTLLSPKAPKDIDPRRYGFRMFATFKTSDKRYAEIVNCGLWVASGAWRGEHLVIDAYRVT
ncbi:hypothetical protein SNK03_009949 [Fusarium graminearum]|uniref:Chromosome 4, complete genome n=2 Tax=Gibberella zeae TaxID=5518 RepID=A0A0E0SB93_GIBZE|nr:hypothetical protein FG05_13579 [Fusarium graminearum]KAI6748268.1 hypothetical protein HG531_008810 [Fusarium graminearum]PCD25736.1 hypothetical protein FGRA07_10932 [Fusarium graminearum]CAF3530130.1 unnamed protein product [Fusarium graminearum]CAF3629683.1 unnamed protein product [Fusarium graminearum]